MSTNEPQPAATNLDTLFAEIAKRIARRERYVTEELEPLKRVVEAAEKARDVLKELAEWYGGHHADDCSMDDTCNCEGKSMNDRWNKAINDSDEALAALGKVGAEDK